MPEPTVDLKNRHLAALLAWMVPGLGHWYQGRRGKAVLYFVCILSVFFAGLALGNWRVVFWRWVPPTNSDQFCLNYLGQFFTGLVALPGLIQATLKRYDMGPILWGYLAEPAQSELNGLYQPLGKFVEMGYLYTTIAGLLNILAIYDAFEGPAVRPEAEADAAEPDTRSKPEPAAPAGVAS